LGALFLERFDRRSALAVAMLGLVTATAAGGLARNFGMLVGARVLAGTFGGPATSIGLAILADVIPPERRGKAMGAVMGAFSAASVLGVPAGLRLSRLGGWPTPFFSVAAMGLVVVIAAIAIMPPMRGHLERRREPSETRGLGAFLADPTVLLSLAGTLCVNMGGFILIPNLSPWALQNAGFPRAQLEIPYAIGGAVSFIAMRVGGRVVDRRGPLVVTQAGAALLIAIMAVSFLPARPLVPVMVIFVGFMLANSVRQVALNTLSTRVPLATERARFMSTQSAVQHLAAASGAMLSAALLANRPDGTLGGMDRVASVSIVLAATVPFFVALVARRLRQREAGARARAHTG
jgi:predicted MFS family arabinose efflux permease